MLDMVRVPEPLNDRPLVWIILGEPKVGKTTLAATFPSPLLIDIEGGTSFIQCPQFPLREIVARREKTAHAILIELYEELKRGDHGYKTVIFDTADELWNVLARPMKKNGKLPLGEYQPLYESFLGILDAFRVLGLDVVLTSHVKHDTDEDGRICDTDIKLPGQLQAMVTAKVDEILYLTVARRKKNETGEDSKDNTEQARYLVCKPVDHPKLGLIKAGDRSGQLPEAIWNPTYEDLKIAKSFKPGLFDGMGDMQDEQEERDTTADELFGATSYAKAKGRKG